MAIRRLRQRYTRTLRIGGIATRYEECHADFGKDQPVSTCSITLPLPLASHVVDNASAIWTASLGGVPFSTPLFVGTLRKDDPTSSDQGRFTTLLAEGPNYRMAIPLNRDRAFTGGARVNPVTLFSGTYHFGTETISWYDHDAPNGGISHDFDVTPTADASFIWLSGDFHGTNSYDESIGDKTIKTSSCAEIWQGGKKRGFANFDVNSERYNEEDPTHFELPANADNWAHFDMMIACRIREDDGPLTIRIKSGLKPGSSDRDEFELHHVTWQIAGKSSVREIGRGLKQWVSMPTSQVNVAEVVALDNTPIRLGGNGLQDAGQVPIDRNDTPNDWYNRILDLFGYADFDCPDGVSRTRLIRGKPAGTPVLTFIENYNVFSVSGGDLDPTEVYNAVEVQGASGNDEDGKRFDYSYETDDDDIEPHPLIPNGRTIVEPISSSLLVSNTLCETVGKIAETSSEPRTFHLETWPDVIVPRPCNVIHLTAPSLGFDDRLFAIKLRFDDDSSGFWMSLDGWTGGSVPFGEPEDPNPAEVNIQPTDRRPKSETPPYRALAEVA